MHVLQQYDKRSLGREHLKEAPNGPRGVGTERLPDPEELRQPLCHRSAVGLPRHPLPERRRDLFRVCGGSAGCLREQVDALTTLVRALDVRGLGEDAATARREARARLRAKGIPAAIDEPGD